MISIFRMSGNALLWFFFFTLWDHSAIYWKSCEEQTLIGYLLCVKLRLKIFFTSVSKQLGGTGLL